jgi:hypothetical protein
MEGIGRTPPVKDVGEPCAGEPHARFDGEGLETEREPPRQPLTPTNLPSPCMLDVTLCEATASVSDPTSLQHPAIGW